MQRLNMYWDHYNNELQPYTTANVSTHHITSHHKQQGKERKGKERHMMGFAMCCALCASGGCMLLCIVDVCACLFVDVAL